MLTLVIPLHPTTSAIRKLGQSSKKLDRLIVTIRNAFQYDGLDWFYGLGQSEPPFIERQYEDEGHRERIFINYIRLSERQRPFWVRNSPRS